LKKKWDSDQLTDFHGKKVKGCCREEKLFKISDNAFRWTCCGFSPGEGLYGCDNHGRKNSDGSFLSSKPCGCDFCKAGRPLSEKFFKKKQHTVGLDLTRGPDPRSLSPFGELNFKMRDLFGMDR